ncbi:hypothetical protein Pfo_015828, partial [Paulownia fortunei]
IEKQRSPVLHPPLSTHTVSLFFLRKRRILLLKKRARIRRESLISTGEVNSSCQERMEELAAEQKKKKKLSGDTMVERPKNPPTYHVAQFYGDREYDCAFFGILEWRKDTSFSLIFSTMLMKNKFFSIAYLPQSILDSKLHSSATV